MNINLEQAIQLRSDKAFESAEEMFTKLIALDDANPRLYYHLAWLYDTMEREQEAIPYYEKAIALNLPIDEIADCFLGLGSTYRAIGEYEKSKMVFENAIRQFPERHDLKVFYAIVLYNLRNGKEAISTLLKIIAQTSSDININRYKNSILKYADDLDMIYE